MQLTKSKKDDIKYYQVLSFQDKIDYRTVLKKTFLQKKIRSFNLWILITMFPCWEDDPSESNNSTVRQMASSDSNCIIKSLCKHYVNIEHQCNILYFTIPLIGRLHKCFSSFLPGFFTQ